MKILRLNNNDNVAVALLPLAAGDVVDGIEVRTDVPRMHKVAVHAIANGETVTKYRQPIGIASADIAPGEHVHSHNCAMTHSRQEAVAGSRFTETEYVADRATFDGFRRDDGRAGTRNASFAQ